MATITSEAYDVPLGWSLELSVVCPDAGLQIQPRMTPNLNRQAELGIAVPDPTQFVAAGSTASAVIAPLWVPHDRSACPAGDEDLALVLTNLKPGTVIDGAQALSEDEAALRLHQDLEALVAAAG